MVAQRAGTSTATVSLVVNGKTAGRVSPENVERVRAAIAELGYVVDHAASSLAKGTSSIVMLIAPDLSNPFFGGVISGIKSTLGPRYQLLLSVTGNGRTPDASDIQQFLALRPAGLLVDAPTEAFITELPADSPLVLLDAPGLEERATTVNFSMREGVEALIDHLAAAGHTRVAYLDSVTGTETFLLRHELLREVATERGMSFFTHPRAISVIDLTAAGTAFAAAWPQWQRDGVTAVICATDTHAYGVLQRAAGMGLSIPLDLAVTGFDNLPYSAISSPSLTTVDLPGFALGAAAARALRARIENEPLDEPPAVLKGTLVIRSSTGGETPAPPPAPAA